MYRIYTDGSSKNGKAGWAFVVVLPDMDIQSSGAIFDTRGTNNIAELVAIYEALTWWVTEYGTTPVTVYTDSMYSINSITKWAQKWEKNGWITTDNKPVKNKELIISIRALCSQNVHFEHVKGHSGDYYNEIVDSLSRSKIDLI